MCVYLVRNPKLCFYSAVYCPLVALFAASAASSRMLKHNPKRMLNSLLAVCQINTLNLFVQTKAKVIFRTA